MDPGQEQMLALLAADIDVYYEQLVTLYWPQLHVFIMRKLGNAHDAEDIVQEAFIRAYVALERYTVSQRQNLKARAWLYKIAWNLYCNFVSRSKSAYILPLGGYDEQSPLEIEDEQSESPEAIFEQVESRQELEALVEGLPPHYRIVVSLYYFEELGYREISEMLNQPLGTVKVYVHRGIKLLRKAFAMQINEVG